MNLDHHLARMSPPDPFTRLADLSEHLAVLMGDKRDAAEIFRRRAKVKDLEADALRRRINRLSMVRARLAGARHA